MGLESAQLHLGHARWFWEDGKFTGARVNDVHLTLAEKKAARENATKK